MGKKRLKIAFLSYYSGDVDRGVETLVFELGNKLVDMGHSITVYQHGSPLPDSHYATKTIAASGIKQFTSQSLGLIDPETQIVLPLNGGWQSLLCKLWAIGNKKRDVVSGQAGPGSNERWNLYTFPDAFIGMTDFQCNWARKINPFVKVAKIPNGIDPSKFTPKSKSRNRKRILCVSAFVPIKRLDLAIKATAKIKNADLTLVGKGELEGYLRDLGDKLMPGRLVITSATYNEVPKVYKDADIFTFPTSPWESFGIVILEAMASGLAVVSSDDPIRREIVGDAGMFVDPENSNEYAKTLESALANNWGDKPRKQAEKFSWDKVARQYEDLFLKLTNG